MDMYFKISDLLFDPTLKLLRSGLFASLKSEKVIQDMILVIRYKKITEIETIGDIKLIRSRTWNPLIVT